MVYMKGLKISYTIQEKPFVGVPKSIRAPG